MCCAAARCAQRVSAQDTRENALARFSLAVSSVAVGIVAGEEAWVLGRVLRPAANPNFTVNLAVGTQTLPLRGAPSSLVTSRTLQV